MSTKAKTPKHTKLEQNHSNIKAKLIFTPVMETKNSNTPSIVNTNRFTNNAYTNRYVNHYNSFTVDPTCKSFNENTKTSINNDEIKKISTNFISNNIQKESQADPQD